MIQINKNDISQVELLLDVQFDAICQQAIVNFDDIQACPGSGKTTMVAAKLLIIAKKWKHNHKGVCVLTHTNVAKKEIIERLRKSADGEKLLSHPHFIGTIQEFVNKFLAIPYLRSNGYKTNTINDDVCSTKGWFHLKHQTRNYLVDRKRITSLAGLEYQFTGDELKLKVPGFNKESESKSYRDLVSAKVRLIEEGYFYYGDMYAFAQYYLLCNPDIINAGRSRFPIVLIDEMQDTQKNQDEILNKMFQYNTVKTQRFGDPDQAIYSGEAEENQTYNRSNLVKIENSHRFVHSIALLAKNLSFNHINLSSCVIQTDLTLHTIFLVDEHSRSDVIDKFAELCEKVVPLGSTQPVKTVGAVGLRKNDGLTICNYVDSYDKSYSTTTFKPQRLIHYFYESRRFKAVHEAYRLILEGVTRCGQISSSRLTFSDGTEEWYTSSNIRKHLKNSGQHINFNILVRCLMKNEIKKEDWDQSVKTIETYLGLTRTDQLNDFLDFSNCTGTVELAVNPNKVITEVNGRLIENEVATIHSVKGETHAATLVLETKNYDYDVGSLIEYILGEKKSTPTGVRKPRLMKQLYVAFSRPKYLLCVALDKSRFPAGHVNKKEYGGWKIVDLTK